MTTASIETTAPKRAMTPVVTARAAHATRTKSTAQDALTANQQALRLEMLRAEREKLERAYFVKVVLPLCAAGYPAPKPQALLVVDRKFRYDYAFIPARLAVEIQGQIWHKGGHTSGRGITRDAEKANELAAIGWRLLIFTPEQITSGEAYDWTERALRAAGFRTTK